MKTGLMAILFAGTALVLSGCDGDQNLEGDVRIICVGGTYGPFNNRQCGPGFRIGRSFNLPLGKGPVIAGATNISSLVFAMDGTNVPLPLSGFLSVSALDANGSIILMSSFPWVRVANDIKPANSQSIKNWISSINSDIYEIKMDLVPFEVISNNGVNTITATIEYENQPLGMGGDVWTSTCPSGGSQVMLCQ